MGTYGATVVDTEPDGFEGVLTTLSAGPLRISSAKSTPAVCRNAANRGKTRDETVFSLQLVYSGRCRIRHAGIETMALPGDMIIADRSKSYELVFAESVQGLVLSPPWPLFRGQAETLEEMAGRPINVNSGPGAVLSTFIRSAWHQLVECEEEEDWPASSAEVIWDLLASVLQGATGREIVSERADSLRREARALIEGRLSDPRFRSSMIAPTLGVSARYLQMVFAEVGTTPSRLLLARRLDVAAARLRRLDAPCSVTDLALECGFNDLSYFSRAFRRRFGVSARTYRMSLGARSVDWP
jgi:AraC-like DNA-binding protein